MTCSPALFTQWIVQVHRFLDISHMFKWVRNVLASLKILYSSHGQEIKWDFVEHLHHLQEKEGLRAGNKLRQCHVEWQKMKMKVCLAALTFSHGVVNAIDFCQDELKMDKFCESEATTEFIQLFDSLFDIMNSRRPLAYGLKGPLQPQTETTWRPYLGQCM